jgi:hypothetical protein
VQVTIASYFAARDSCQFIEWDISVGTAHGCFFCEKPALVILPGLCEIQ